MNTFHRLLATSVVLLATLAGCATAVPSADAQAVAALAPTGTLRIGVYRGSPTSLVLAPRTGEAVGVAHDLGLALGKSLGVRTSIVEFGRVAQVLDALKAGELDFTFTNATESRARDVDFTPPLVRLELGYLVLADSAITSIADVDRPGVRVGVAQGSTSQGTLTRQFRNAVVVPAPSLKAAQDMLRQKTIDAFATNKGILFEMSDALSGARVLDGRWGFEALAIAVPKGREAGLPYLRGFAKAQVSSGQMGELVKRAGLRGTVSGE